MAVALTIPVSSIVVGDRRREEMGDIAGLAENIRQHGLLHPIVVDIERHLIAGGRRLEAVKLLGWEKVPVSMRETTSEAERREIELAENLNRKDFTSQELVKVFDEAKQVLRDRADNNPADSAGKIGRGRPAKPDSDAKAAELIGVPLRTVELARQHVAAVEAHPELASEPQSTAIDYAKAVKQEPALAGSPIANVVNHYRAHPRRQPATQPALPTDADDAALLAKLPPKIEEPDNVKAYRLLMRAMLHLTSGAPAKGELNGPDPEWVAANMPTPDDGNRLLREVESVEKWCAKTRAALEREMATPLRAVK